MTEPTQSLAETPTERLADRRRRRVGYSFIAIGVVLVVGTLGFYALTSAGWIDAFYFECMLATGQGPPFPLTTNGSKLFASLMAFVSVGTVLTTLLVNLAPFIARVWREAIEESERELRKFEHKVTSEFHRRESP